MTTERESADELSLAMQQAGIAIVGTVTGLTLGPAAAVGAALLGPFAVLTGKRLLEMVSRVESAGFDSDAIVERLGDEELAYLVANAIRATVESELAAKRAMLAAAVIRALEDDAVVDEDQRMVRAATLVDTVDIRVLAILGDPPVRGEDDKVPPGHTSPEELIARWPGASAVAEAATSALVAAGLAIVPTGWGDPNHIRLTAFGEQFLERLRQEGLDGELNSRDKGTPP